MGVPRRDRPEAPRDYGFSTEPEGLLEWERVADAIRSASIYWIGTARPDGSPHVHPIWGGFAGDSLFIEGGDSTRWARNLAGDARVAFGVDAGGLHISGRGLAERGAAGSDFESLRTNYGSKYDYKPEADEFWRIRPSVIIALDMSSLELFANTPTRFTF